MRQIYFIALATSLLFPQIADACESNSYSYSRLNRENWARIKQMMASNNRSIEKKTTMKSHITGIIGYPGTCSSSADGRTEKCTWTDGQDCKKKINASFRNNELSKITKSGF